jgi:hypothetical protein
MYLLTGAEYATSEALNREPHFVFSRWKRREVSQARTSINDQYNMETYIPEEQHFFGKQNLVFNTAKSEMEENLESLQFNAEYCALSTKRENTCISTS